MKTHNIKTIEHQTNGNDWEVLLIDGKKFTSGHNIALDDLEELFELLGIEYKRVYGEFIDDDEDSFVPDEE